VVVPWITDQRLDEVLSEPVEWIYVALRSGITGTYTELGADQEAFLTKLRARRPSGDRASGDQISGGGASGGLKVMAGFGIQDAAQVAAVTAMADAAIVGSSLVRAIAESGAEGAGDAVRRLVETLRGK
jgi:tryptophan synthase alpha chain